MAKNNMAMAYAMKKKSKMMADGGFVSKEKMSGYEDHDSGAMTSDYPSMDLNQLGDEDEGAGGGNEINPFVMKIMMGRAKGYSEGGQVANEQGPLADHDPNEFDDLALRDDLESSYTGANSGDELGNTQEDEDRANIIKKIMQSRAKRDRNPRLA